MRRGGSPGSAGTLWHRVAALSLLCAASAVGVVIAAPAPPAHALDPVNPVTVEIGGHPANSGFLVFVEGNVRLNNDESEGTIAAGGNLHLFKNYQIAAGSVPTPTFTADPDTGPTYLYVGGSIVSSTGQLPGAGAEQRIHQGPQHHHLRRIHHRPERRHAPLPARARRKHLRQRAVLPGRPNPGPPGRLDLHARLHRPLQHPGRVHPLRPAHPGDGRLPDHRSAHQRAGRPAAPADSTRKPGPTDAHPGNDERPPPCPPPTWTTCPRSGSSTTSHPRRTPRFW